MKEGHASWQKDRNQIIGLKLRTLDFTLSKFYTPALSLQVINFEKLD